MNIFKVVILGGLWFNLVGFVLLSGPKESKLIRNQQNEVYFVWNGQSPTIKDIQSFKNGELSNLSQEQLFAAIIQLTMNIWNSVPGTAIKLVLDQNIDPELQRNSNDQIHAIVTESSNNSTSAAFAVVNNDENDINPDQKYIIDCDISISSNSVSADDLAFTLLHELGHCLGLGHNHLSYTSVMSYANLSKKLSLDIDDKLGILYLYADPNEASKVKEIIPCGMIHSSSTVPKINLLLILILPVLLLITTHLFLDKRH